LRASSQMEETVRDVQYGLVAILQWCTMWSEQHRNCEPGWTIHITQSSS